MTEETKRLQDIHGKRIRSAEQIRRNKEWWAIVNACKKPAHARARRLTRSQRPTKTERERRGLVQRKIHLARKVLARRIHRAMAVQTRFITGQYPMYRS